LIYLMQGLNALPLVSGVLFRGVPSSDGILEMVQSTYSLGTDIHWSAFTSCTDRLDSAREFARGRGGIIFRMQILSGRDIRDYSAFRRECEVLLSPNIKFVVSGACNLEDDGYYYVDLVERRGQQLVF
jgi:hypothetical protein